MKFAANVLLAGSLLFGSRIVWGANWRPVSRSELAMAKPVIDGEAGAEALFVDIHVHDEVDGSSFHNVREFYFRLKVFTESGKNEYGTVQIPYSRGTEVSNVAGRTIRPDGSILELTKDSIFEKTLVKANGLKVRSKSLAMPGIGPGTIIEYQWRETHNDQISHYLRLPLQFEMPAEQIAYHVRPLQLEYVSYHMRLLPFNCSAPSFQAEKNGFYVLQVSNVHAFRMEHHMPPENQVKQWVLALYEPDRDVDPDKYWKTIGREFYSEYSPEVKVNGEVKRLASSLTEGAKTDEERITRLATYCHKNIRNIQGAELSIEERERVRKNNSTADTLRRGQGTPLQIELAFLALALAEGFDARLARVPDRNDIFFSKSLLTPYFLTSYDAAVRVNGKWQFYDVADKDLPVGRLRWQEEGVLALIADAKEPVFVSTPFTTADVSRSARIASLTLTSEGGLEGDARCILTGHPAIEFRSEYGPLGPEERIEKLRKQALLYFADAVVTNLTVNMNGGTGDAVGYRYHLQIPGYAQRTEKRMFFVPSFFQAGKRAEFPESNREYPVYFKYPWSEQDSVEVRLPEGFELDHADAPPGISFGPAGSYRVKISTSPDKHSLIYERTFSFGVGGTLLFERSKYPALKAGFDLIHEHDSHLIGLRAQAVAQGNR